MQTDVEEITEKIIPILRAAGVTRAALFGSYVREEARADSDLDILVALPEKASLLDLASLKLKLEEVLGRNVDVLTYDALHPLIRPTIEKDQVAIL